MKTSPENSAVFEVLRRWMPELQREALASGQGADHLLEQALQNVLPRTEEVDIPRMIAESRASGSHEIKDLDQWQAKRENALKRRLSNRS